MKEQYRRMMEQVTLDDKARAAILDSLEPRPRRKVRPLRAAVIASCVCLVLAAAVRGGLILPPYHEGPVPPVASPAADAPPAESEYDIFGDSNVLWGSGEDTVSAGDGLFYPSAYGAVFRGSELLNLMETATETDLIVFWVMDYDRLSDDYPVDIDQLLIPEELDQDGALTALLEAYNSASGEERSQAYENSGQYLRVMTGEYLTEYTGPADELHAEYYESFFIYTALEKERDNIELDVANAVMQEWGKVIDPINATDEERAAWFRVWDAAEAEAERRLLENERYQEILSQLTHYDKLRTLTDEFWDRWNTQYEKHIRDRFTGWGFIPVYDMDELSQGDYSKKLVLTFAGTAEQLWRLDLLIAEDECFCVLAAEEYLLGDAMTADE